MNIRKTMKLHNYILVIFLLLFSTILFNNKTIEKETKTFKNNVKALDQEGQNYRLVTSADNIQVPVPKGYVASNVTGENYVTPEYQHTTNTEGEDIKTRIHDGGFVIYQLTDEEIETDPNGTNIIINDTNKDIAQSTRNQYVWVPVPSTNEIVRTKTINNGIMQFGQSYKFSSTSIKKETSTNSDYYKEPKLLEDYDKTKYRLQIYSNLDKREDYLNKMQEDFTRMIKSINKYKGFYIGRYETGDEISHDSNKGYFKKPKIVRYNNNINYVSWYNCYKDLERLAGKTEKYVETGMIYDTMWDYTLKWLKETDTRSYYDIAEDSITWGNYANSSLKYKNSVNGTENTKKPSYYVVAPTGGITEITYQGETYSNFPTSSNNIFDMAGNIREWTRTRNWFNNSQRGIRGGYNGYNSFIIPVRSNGSDIPNTIDKSNGVRGILLIR